MRHISPPGFCLDAYLCATLPWQVFLFCVSDPPTPFEPLFFWWNPGFFPLNIYHPGFFFLIVVSSFHQLLLCSSRRVSVQFDVPPFVALRFPPLPQMKEQKPPVFSPIFLLRDIPPPLNLLLNWPEI